MHIPYEKPEHPERYIILNHSPFYSPAIRFCRCKTNSKHKKLCFPNIKTPHSMFEKGQIYICIKSDNSVWIDTPGWWGRYYTLKQFEKWFDEIIDYDIHTLEKAREKYKK